MPAKKDKKTISFVIKNIELLNKTLNLPELPDLAEDKLPPHEFLVGLEIRVNEEDKTSAHAFEVKIVDKEKNELVWASLRVGCIFSILNFDDIVIRKEDGQTEMPDEYINLLNTIAIGTSRGVLYSELRGTFLHHAILPILDVKSFVYSKQ